jgi:hypothetical protein
VTDHERLWWTTLGLTFATIGQVYTVVAIMSVKQTSYDQMLEHAQQNAGERERLGAALEICVRSMSDGEWHQPEDCKVEGRSRRCRMCKAIRQAKRAWKDVYGDSL